MIQLRLLSGEKTGTMLVVRSFPCVIGRETAGSLDLRSAGVWERHIVLHLRMPDGVVLESRPEAATLVNGQMVQSAVLRSGDIVELGANKLLFGLSDSPQRSLRVREALLWVVLAMILLIEAALFYWWLP